MEINLTPMNTTASIVSVTLDTSEHFRHRIQGTDIRQAMAVLKPYQQDIDARVTIPCNPGKRNRKHDVVQIRFIALYNALNDDYHTFFTNIPAQDLSGKDVGALYVARWDSENLFRELKSENLLDRLQSKNEYITEIFLRIPIIRVRISRKLFGTARKILGAPLVTRLKQRLWSIVFAENARRILASLMRENRNLRVFEPWWEIWKTLVTGSISAHVTRLTHTSQWYRRAEQSRIRLLLEMWLSNDFQDVHRGDHALSAGWSG